MLCIVDAAGRGRAQPQPEDGDRICVNCSKELERRLNLAKIPISPQLAAELTQTMYEMTFRLPNDPEPRRTLLQMDDEQQRLYELFV